MGNCFNWYLLVCLARSNPTVKKKLNNDNDNSDTIHNSQNDCETGNNSAHKYLDCISKNPKSQTCRFQAHILDSVKFRFYVSRDGKVVDCPGSCWSHKRRYSIHFSPAIYHSVSFFSKKSTSKCC